MYKVTEWLWKISNKMNNKVYIETMAGLCNANKDRYHHNHWSCQLLKFKARYTKLHFHENSVIINDAVNAVQWIFYWHCFYTLLVIKKGFASVQNSRWTETLVFRVVLSRFWLIWLAINFTCSTDMSVIGYISTLPKHVLKQSAISGYWYGRKAGIVILNDTNQFNKDSFRWPPNIFNAGKPLLKCEFRTAMYWAFKFDLNVITSVLDMHVNDKDVSRLTNCD